MANKQKILIVDDDENIAELISLYMTKECFETKLVYDGESALREVNSFAPDLILLDLMLPGIDGYQVCRKVRQKSQTPIIMLSAKGEVFDKVLGLELGADDYLEKPFDTKELIARVKAVLRRYKTAAPAEPASDAKQVSYPNLTINLTNYSVIYNNKPWRCRQRNSNFCTSSLHRPTMYTPANNSSTKSGVMNTSETRAPSMCISSGCARRLKTMKHGALQPSGALATNSK